MAGLFTIVCLIKFLLSLWVTLFCSLLPFGEGAELMVMYLGSMATDGLSDQVSVIISTQNEGMDGYSLDSVNTGLPQVLLCGNLKLSHHRAEFSRAALKQDSDSCCKEMKVVSFLLCYHFGLGKAVISLSPFTVCMREKETDTFKIFNNKYF